MEISSSFCHLFPTIFTTWKHHIIMYTEHATLSLTLAYNLSGQVVPTVYISNHKNLHSTQHYIVNILSLNSEVKYQIISYSIFIYKWSFNKQTYVKKSCSSTDVYTNWIGNSHKSYQNHAVHDFVGHF